MSQLTAIPVLEIALIHRFDQPCLIASPTFEWWWNGRHFRLASDTYTDGLSSPQFTHSLAEPYGWGLLAAVPHDAGYHDSIEECVNGQWVHVTLTKDECDRMFYDLLLVLAAGKAARVMQAMAFYEAVHLGGLEAFNQGRERAAIRRAQKEGQS